MTAANVTNLPAVNVAPMPARHRPHGMVLSGMQDCLRFAEVAVASGLLSPGFMKARDPVAAAFIALQLGAEVGLSPMASLQNIAVINGKPGLYGPAMLAVVEASGLLEVFEEWIEGEGDKMVAYCKVKRIGRPERLTAFSMADARKANLTGKQGPWQEYPRRMLQARARSFALRDIFPDILSGLNQSVEELQDIPAEPRDITPPKLKEPTPQTAPPPAVPAAKPTIKVKVPGQPSAEFAQDVSLEAALVAAMAFMSDAINEGRTDVVAANNALLDRIANRLPEMADDVAELRAAAAMQDMIDASKADEPEPEPEEKPDTFVERFVNGDDAEPDDFPGDLPPKPNP